MSSRPSKAPARNALYAQSGGVSAVINASACGVIETARKHPSRIGKIYAGRDGIIGALTENLIDLSRESPAFIRGLRYTPAGAFGSARFKLKSIEQNRAEYERLIDVFRAHDIGYFFYNGGNDSMDTALEDLAARQHARTTRWSASVSPRQSITICRSPIAARDSARWPSTSRSPRSRAGWTSPRWRVHRPRCSCSRSWAGTPAGSQPPADSRAARPRSRRTSFCFRRSASNSDKFLARVKQCVTDYGYCVIVVSEGARYADGRFLAESGTTDAFGHTQLGGVGPVVANMVREAHGYKYHWAVADYLQRSARHVAAKTDVDQAYAVGKAAVEYALAGMNAVMPAIKRLSSKPYRWKLVPVPISEVANIEKKVPRHFITEDGFGITAACRRYLEPLIGGEDAPPYRDGLPAYVRLRGTPVRRKLKTDFHL